MVEGGPFYTGKVYHRLIPGKAGLELQRRTEAQQYNGLSRSSGRTSQPSAKVKKAKVQSRGRGLGISKVL